MSDLPPLESEEQKQQRLLEELVALIGKRRETRPEDYVTVEAQIAATETELRKLHKAPARPA